MEASLSQRRDLDVLWRQVACEQGVFVIGSGQKSWWALGPAQMLHKHHLLPTTEPKLSTHTKSTHISLYMSKKLTSSVSVDLRVNKKFG